MTADGVTPAAPSGAPRGTSGSAAPGAAAAAPSGSTSERDASSAAPAPASSSRRCGAAAEARTVDVRRWWRTHVGARCAASAMASRGRTRCRSTLLFKPPCNCAMRARNRESRVKCASPGQRGEQAPRFSTRAPLSAAAAALCGGVSPQQERALVLARSARACCDTRQRVQAVSSVARPLKCATAALDESILVSHMELPTPEQIERFVQVRFCALTRCSQPCRQG